MDLTRKKTCDICGRQFIAGIRIKGIRQKDLKVCDKCEGILMGVILAYRGRERKIKTDSE